MVLNLIMYIQRRGKSGCEISIDHYRNLCKNATFLIQVIETLLGNDYEIRIKNIAMLEYRLQCEGYWIKTLRTV